MGQQKDNASVGGHSVIAWLHGGIDCARGKSRSFMLPLLASFGILVLYSSIFRQPRSTEVVVSYQRAGNVDAPANPAGSRALRRAATGFRKGNEKDGGLRGVEQELEQELEQEIEWIEDEDTLSEMTTEMFMQAERMDYLKRHNLLDENAQPRLKDFDDAFANMFPTTTETVKTIRSIRELHATYPAEKPKACVTILVYPVHCGANCIAPMSKDRTCTQDRAVKILLRNIQEKFLQKNPYPIVLLHQDLTEEDIASFRAATGATLFFQRVIFDEDTLPSYLDREAFLSWIRPKHPENNIQLPSPKLHGFGYRMMCRLFSGLLFHAPVMREFDYYIRVDGGDSRVWELDWDPFVRMVKEGTAYAYLKTSTNFLSFFGPPVFDYLDEHPEVKPDRRLLCSQWIATPAHIVTSTIVKLWDQHYPFGKRLTHNFCVCHPSFDKFIDSGHAHHDYGQYNNFEAVYMPAFRTKEHWEFFLHIDKLNLIVCNYDQETKQCRTGGKDWEYKHVGDGDFRTVSAGLVLDSSKVKRWANFPYVHPVPDWCQA